MKFLCDIGGSALRLMHSEEPNKTYVFDSVYKELEKDEHPRQGVDPKEFLSTMVRLSDGTIISKNVVVGKSAKLYGTPEVRAFNDKFKSSSEVTTENILLGLYRTIIDSNIPKDGVIKIDQLTLLLPAIEVYSPAGQTYRDKLRMSRLIIDRHLLDGNPIKILIKEVVLAPEGAMIASLASKLFKKDLSDKNILVIDSGERTTNMCLVRNNELVSGGADTLKLSGQVFKAAIAEVLRTKEIYAEDNDIIEIIKTKSFHNKIDCKAVVELTVKKYTQELYKGVMSFLNARNIPLDTIDTIIFTGRVFAHNNFNTTLEAVFINKEIYFVPQEEANLVSIIALQDKQTTLAKRASRDLEKELLSGDWEDDDTQPPTPTRPTVNKPQIVYPTQTAQILQPTATEVTQPVQQDLNEKPNLLDLLNEASTPATQTTPTNTLTENTLGNELGGLDDLINSVFGNEL